MYVFFRCVGEAVAENGLGGLAGMVPGGAFAFDVARVALEKYRHHRRDEAIREEVQALARAGFEDARQAAVEVAREIAVERSASPGELDALELYLTAIPAAVQQSLRRADDPGGTIVPLSFALDEPDDVLRLLPPRPPRFRPGGRFPGKPGWTLERPLGIGGFGEVWLARHPRLESLRGAVKFCHDLKTRDRDLLHEGGLIDRIMANGRHPNIVPLLDADLDGDLPWLMFEFVDGGTLLDRVREWERLEASERLDRATAALKDMASAVGQFHRLEPPVVHRDLKPSNVLVDQSADRLRITDFGIGGIAARDANQREGQGGSTRSGRLLSSLRGSYTPLYSSPQQRNGDPPDPRDDVHALGVLGYQMVTGHLTQGAGPDFADDLRDAGTGEELIALLGRCVAQKADRRPNDAAELAEAMASLGTVPAFPAMPPLFQVSDFSTPQPSIAWTTSRSHSSQSQSSQSRPRPLNQTIRSAFKSDLEAHDAQIVRNSDPRPYLESAAPSRLDDWQTGSDHRHPVGDLMLGLSLIFGIGCPADREAAIRLIERSADRGLSAAQYHRGVMAGEGDVVPRSVDRRTVVADRRPPIRDIRRPTSFSAEWPRRTTRIFRRSAMLLLSTIGRRPYSAIPGPSLRSPASMQRLTNRRNHSDRLARRLYAMVTRRHFLAASAIAPTAAAILATETPRVPVVDTHLHCFAGTADKRFPYHADAPYRPTEPSSPEHLLKLMAAAGVDYAVVVHPEPYQDDHRYLEHCLTVGQGKLKGTVLFFAGRPGTPAALKAIVKDNPIVALRVHAYSPDRLPPFGKPELRDLWKLADELGIAVQLHFEPRYASGFEPLVKEFDQVKVFVDHLGRPFQGTPKEHARVVGWADFGNVLMKLSSIPSERNYPHRSPAKVVRELADAFGPDRLMYGGGYGADATAATYRAARERVGELLAHLPAADRAKILGGTAARVMGFGQ